MAFGPQQAIWPTSSSSNRMARLSPSRVHAAPRRFTESTPPIGDTGHSASSSPLPSLSRAPPLFLSPVQGHVPAVLLSPAFVKKPQMTSPAQRLRARTTPPPSLSCAPRRNSLEAAHTPCPDPTMHGHRGDVAPIRSPAASEP